MLEYGFADTETSVSNPAKAPEAVPAPIMQSPSTWRGLGISSEAGASGSAQYFIEVEKRARRLSPAPRTVA